MGEVFSNAWALLSHPVTAFEDRIAAAAGFPTVAIPGSTYYGPGATLDPGTDPSDIGASSSTDSDSSGIGFQTWAIVAVCIVALFLIVALIHEVREI